MSYNSPEDAEQSHNSEKILFDILKQSPLRYYDLRRAVEDEEKNIHQDSRLHYDLAWYDLVADCQYWADVKTVRPANRGTGNYTVRKPCLEYVFGLAETLMEKYYWVFELYGADFEPTGRFVALSCKSLFEIRDSILEDAGTHWLLDFAAAVSAIPEGKDRFVIEPDIPG